MIAQENGLLPIITFDAQTTWDDLLKVATPHLNENGRVRLQTALNQRAQSVVVEREYIDKDYRDTFQNFHAKKFSTPDSRCVRLHFFSAPVDHDTIRDANQVQGAYLGYSVIRPTRPNCMGRTLLSPAACGLTTGHIKVCEEKVSIQGVDLKITGFPFISQDADVTVCAQSAMWMLVRYFSNRYPIYPEIYPFRLTTLTQDYSIGRLVPTSGLRVWQMAEALRQLTFAPLIYDRQHYPDEFDHLLYTYIESGIPVLAAFANHAVVLFGHRSDYSAVGAAVPSAGMPCALSSAFNRAFIGHDDNGSPYQLLEQTIQAGGMPHTIAEIQQFIAPLPERVFLSAENFQAAVVALLTGSKFGFAALSPTLASGVICARLYLTTGSAFKRQLDARGMGHPLVNTVYRNLPLPHFVWICELSTPTLYPAMVVGEILWDATRNAYEPDGWIALHYPEILIFDRGSALNRPPDLVRFDLSPSHEYPIYKSNLVNP